VKTPTFRICGDLTPPGKKLTPFELRARSFSFSGVNHPFHKFGNMPLYGTTSLEKAMAGASDTRLRGMSMRSGSAKPIPSIRKPKRFSLVLRTSGRQIDQRQMYRAPPWIIYRYSENGHLTSQCNLFLFRYMVRRNQILDNREAKRSKSGLASSALKYNPEKSFLEFTNLNMVNIGRGGGIFMFIHSCRVSQEASSLTATRERLTLRRRLIQEDYLLERKRI